MKKNLLLAFTVLGLLLSQSASAGTDTISNAGISINGVITPWVVARDTVAPQGWTVPSYDPNYNTQYGFVAPITTNWSAAAQFCYNSDGIWYPITNTPPTGWAPDDSIPVYFRLAFNLPNDMITDASISLFIDDLFTLYVNGNYIGGPYNGRVTYPADSILRFLHCGANVIAIEGKNTRQPCYMLNLFSGSYITVDTSQPLSGKCTTGINDVASSEALLFHPNPAKDRLYLDQSIPGATYTVVDMTGRTLSVPVSEREINVSALPTGVYCLRVQTASGSIQKRFVKE